MKLADLSVEMAGQKRFLVNEIRRLCDRVVWCQASRKSGDLDADLDSLEEQREVVEMVVGQLEAGAALPGCGGCIALQAELDSCAEAIGPQLLAECDGHVYEAVHRLAQDLARERMRREEAEKSALRHEKWANEARAEAKRWEEVAADLQETNDERREMLDIAAERDRDLCSELDQCRTYLDSILSVINATRDVNENIDSPQAREAMLVQSEVRAAMKGYEWCPSTGCHDVQGS